MENFPTPATPSPGPSPAAAGPETAVARQHEVTLRFLAAPTDRGKSGTVDAGRVLEWVDKAAFATSP